MFPSQILMDFLLIHHDLLRCSQILLSQEVNKDSVVIKSKECHKARKKVTITIENRSGMELQRMNPMAPLVIFKWSGKEWQQVSQIGYCACGIVQCPPPPEQLPFSTNEILEFEWDQMESRCLDNEKGIKEIKWAGKGKYKAVFEMKKDRNGESFFIEKKFKIR